MALVTGIRKDLKMWAGFGIQGSTKNAYHKQNSGQLGAPSGDGI
jgi:hypothetical protein